MRAEPGQLRVWLDSIAYDKTPFLVVGPCEGAVVTPEGWEDWVVIYLGKKGLWTRNRLEMFSEVISESG